MRLKIFLSVFLSILMFSNCGRLSTSYRIPYAGELQAVLDEARQATGVMGVSTAMFLPGYEPWLGVSGESYPGRPMEAGMLFDMGSASKMVVGPLMVKLAEDGLISLDDPIGEYLPGFPYADEAITIRQLLNHTSGLFMMTEHPDSPFRTRFSQIDHERWWTLDETFTELGGEAYFAPGEGYCYTQAGYQIAGLIVEGVTGSPVSEAVQERLFDPLEIDGMVLDFSEPVSEEYEFAHPWVDIDSDGVYEDVNGYSKNWIASLSRIMFYTSAQDFARWGQALFAGEVLNQASMDQLLDFYPIEAWCGEVQPLDGYGLGVQEFSPELAHGQTAWGHLGSIQGYRAILLHLPQHGLTLAVMTNTDTDQAMPIVDGLLDVVFDHQGVVIRDLPPVDVEPVNQPPAGAPVVETFQKETLFCDHNPVWEVEAGREDWIDISLEWVVGTDLARAENAWLYHQHTITINGQAIGGLEAFTHGARQYTVPCPGEALEIWAKGLSIFLPPLPAGEYQVKWLSEITGEFNNGWVDYQPGNYMEMVANLSVK